jgi:hypothetical protein
MQQGNEDLGLGLAEVMNGGPDDAEATGVAVLLTQTIVDAPSGVPLLGRGLAIFLEDPADAVEEGTEDRLGSGLGLPEGRRFGLLDDAGDGAKVEGVLAAGLPEAQTDSPRGPRIRG